MSAISSVLFRAVAKSLRQRKSPERWKSHYPCLRASSPSSIAAQYLSASMIEEGKLTMRFLWINDKTEGGGAVKLFGSARRTLEPYGHEVAPFFGLIGPNAIDPEWEALQPPSVRARDPLAIALRAFPNREITRRLKAILDSFKPDVAVVQNVHQYLSPAVFKTLRCCGVPSVFILNDYALYCVNKYAFRNEQPCHKCLDHRYYRGALLRCSLKPGPMGCLESAVRATALHYSSITKAFACAGSVYTNGSVLVERLIEYGFPSNRIVTGVFPLNIEAQPLEDPAGIADYFVYYGGEAAAKGQNVLLDALELIDTPLQLKLCLLRPSEALSKRVRHINSTSKHNVEIDDKSRWETGVRETVRSARAVIVPSLWNSPHELVTYESLALGKALIVSSRTGNADLVEHGRNGLIFQTGNATSLACQINRLMVDPTAAIKLGREARKTYESQLLPDMWLEPFMRAVDIARTAPRV